MSLLLHDPFNSNRESNIWCWDYTRGWPECLHFQMVILLSYYWFRWFEILVRNLRRRNFVRNSEGVGRLRAWWEHDGCHLWHKAATQHHTCCNTKLQSHHSVAYAWSFVWLVTPWCPLVGRRWRVWCDGGHHPQSMSNATHVTNVTKLVQRLIWKPTKQKSIIHIKGRVS